MDGTHPTRDATVADKSRRLVGPFVKQVVNRVEQRRGNAVVVFWSDEHERIGRFYNLTPHLRVFVNVFGEPRVLWFVEQRQVELLEIDQRDLEVAMALCQF